MRSHVLLLSFLGAMLGCGAAESREAAPAANSQAAVPAAASAAPSPAVAGDWPRWRGPNLDGISPDTNWRSEWDEKPAQLWAKEIGVGFSSMSVADGRLYAMGHKEGQDTVYCLDAKSGDEIWTHSYSCKLVDNLHEGGPAATPTVDGDRAYTVSKEGHLFCLDAATGKVHWQRKFPDEFGVKMPAWGFSCSPLIWNDLVVVDAGRAAAFNKLSGEVVWQTEKYKPGYGSAVNFKHDGEDLIALLNNQALIIVRAADGKLVAETKWETSYDTSAATPIIAPDGTIFISTGYQRGCARFRLAGDKLEYVYENKNMSNHMNNSVLWKGHLYGFDGNSHAARQVRVVCMNYESGEQLWKERGLGCGSLMLAGDTLILLSDEGKLVTAEPTPEGFRPLSEAQILEGKCWTVPILAHGLLYARNAAGDLVCVDLRK